MIKIEFDNSEEKEELLEELEYLEDFFRIGTIEVFEGTIKLSPVRIHNLLKLKETILKQTNKVDGLLYNN